MKAFTIVLFVTASLFTLSAHAQSCGNEILDPVPFDWGDPVGALADEHYVGTMEIAEATLTVGGETITTRVYRQAGTAGTIPGPTLVMQPGKKYVLRFHNLLPYEPRSTEHNVFKDPNVSNLHTHGLHISGMSPGDDVTRDFAGGEGGDFVYDIPDDHMGGTFWYHAHHHGSTFLQVSAGAFGLIVIDDAADGIPDHVAAMEERHLVVAYLDPDVAGTGGDTLISGTLSPTWTVNGKVGGDLCMPPNTWQHWRVLLADRDAKEKTVSVGAGCEVALMARDGVWRTEAPRQVASNSLSLTGASRADLAVRCSANAGLTVAGQTVANIVVSGTQGDTSAHPFVENQEGNYEATWSAIRPDYLRDLRGENANINTETVNMGARTINGSKFDKENATFTFESSAIQDWTLKGARNHPFHLHVYHVQVQGDCGSFEDGEYYDVISGNCNIRFDLDANTSSPYSGRTIMHCHILEHEDQGAMGWANVQVPDALGPPTFPDVATYGYSESYVLGDPPDTSPKAPSGLTAATVSDTEIDISWTDNSNDEDRFDVFQSLDGSNFTLRDFVGANVTTYSDTGLESNTEYFYRVRAVRGGDVSEFSGSANATTDPEPSGEPTKLQLRSLTAGTVSAGRGFKHGQAVVVVEDDTGAPVAGVTVYGYFNGTFSDVFDVNNPGDPTGADGSTEFLSGAQEKGSVSVGFCVTEITDGDGGLTDYPSDPDNPGGEICVAP